MGRKADIPAERKVVNGISIEEMPDYAKKVHAGKSYQPSLWWNCKGKCKITQRTDRIVGSKIIGEPQTNFLETNGIFLSIRALKHQYAETSLKLFRPKKGQHSSETMKKIHLNFAK